MTYNAIFGLFRLILGFALLGSVTWQVTDRLLNNLFRPTEYFAYFSIVSAIFAGFVLVTTGAGLAVSMEDTKWVEIARLSMTVAMIVVAVVYHLLLAGVASDVRDVGYVWPVLPNEIIHTYAPVLMVLEYLATVKSFKIRFRAALWVAVFPLTWLVFSVIRGLGDNWWPYWFINPNGEGGLGGMLTYISAITLFFLVLGFAVLAAKQGFRRLITK